MNHSLVFPAKFQFFCQRLGEISLIATCFFLPWSVALMNVSALLMALCWFLSGKFLELPKILRQSPSAVLAVALFLLLAVSLIYTTAPVGYGLDIASKYRKLLYLPVVLSIVNGAPVLRRRAIDAFLWGCALLLLASYFKLVTVLLGTNIFIDRHGFSFVHHITHGFFMAIFIFFLIERAITAKDVSGRWSLPFLITAALAGFNLFYITPGRTGWGLCLALTAFFFIRRRSWRWSLTGLAIVTASMIVIWQSSSIVSARSWELIHETERYQPGESRTSMGQRYDWWHNAYGLVRQSPWLGKGVGSFPSEQRELVKSLRQPTQPTDNPHNEYLFLAEQIGVCGLLLFVALLAAPSIEARGRGFPPDERRLIEGLTLAMALSCLVNSHLFDSQQGHFYILITALLLAGGGKVANEKSTAASGTESLT
ncbi:MAG: O-antigen ligase family protein [Treponema sp.]|nr:O-antigen ligase family protein [Treponema sp.]